MAMHKTHTCLIEKARKLFPEAARLIRQKNGYYLAFDYESEYKLWLKHNGDKVAKGVQANG